MTVLLFLAIVVLAGFQAAASRRLRALEDRLDALRENAPPAHGEAPRAAAVVLHARREAPPEPVPAPARAAPRRSDPVVAPRAREPARPAPLTFEAVVGGKLPFWIGGAALVLAAFFLVRYSIENGLLGPAARTIIAALFGMVLIAASDLARRWAATREDPRLGQSLAGAGIAVLYGTLYVGAALYHLVGTTPALIAMTAVTLGALGLALRHGPPTAIMALIGGFAAPLLAGFDSAGIGPLLVYLALLVAVLFGVAIRRGWAWLALAACGGGFLWVNLLLALLDGRALPGIGGFVVLLAIGATLALPRTGAARPVLRLVPLVAGLVQLLVLAPALDFGPLAWGLYLLLGGAALVLGWRDPALAPGAAAALALMLVMLGIALAQGDRATAPIAAVALTLLFGAAGHVRYRRAPLWAGLAVVATAAPAMIVAALGQAVLGAAGWTALFLLLATASATLAWRARDRARAAVSLDVALSGATLAAALLVALAAGEALPEPWRWSAWLALAPALAWWGRRIGDAAIRRAPYLPLAATALAVLAAIDPALPYLRSIATAAAAPPLADLVAVGVLPAVTIAATARLLGDPRDRPIWWWIALALGLAFIPAALPQPWHGIGLGAATALLILRRPMPDAAIVAAAVTLAFAAAPILDLLRALMLSLGGARLPYRSLPTLATTLREIALPTVMIAAALWHRPPAIGTGRDRAITALAIVALAVGYAIAKQPLAIATLPRFEQWGFAERAAITQALFALGWLARRRSAVIARALLVLALARIGWFDLLVLDPALVAQHVGGLPLLNLATLHVLAAAAWLWPDRADRRWRGIALGLLLVAALALVRQATHGTLLTGDLGRTENWLYSAALLVLSLVWLAFGIARRIPDLRLAGLGLLTLVTIKVFLIDAAALAGILRILSFLGVGVAIMGAGWAYNRMVRADQGGTI